MTDTEIMDIINPLVRGFHASTGIDESELLSLAGEAYSRNISKYDPGRASLKTWMSTIIVRNFINYLSRHSKIKRREFQMDSPPENPYNVNPEVQLDFRERIEQLSPMTRKLCKMIFAVPEDFLNLEQREITALLRKKDWKWNDIRLSYIEIRKLLKGEYNDPIKKKM
jgi:DNA-directed RNA polymerase specialized sigma24 family protein